MKTYKDTAAFELGTREPAATPSGSGKEWTKTLTIMFREIKSGQVSLDRAYRVIDDAHKAALSLFKYRDCGNDTKRLDWLNHITERANWLGFWQDYMSQDIREAIDAAMQETHRGESQTK